MQTIEISFGRLHAVPIDCNPRDRAASFVLVCRILDALLRDTSETFLRMMIQSLKSSCSYLVLVDVSLLQSATESYM